MKNVYRTLILFLPVLFLVNCNKNETENPCSFFVPVSKAQDKQFGRQLDSAIRADPATYPILDSNKYSDVYKYVKAIKNDILNSEFVCNAEEFEWKVTIIHDDVLNAFAAPGGYIYVYTGLMHYLDSASHFAGVMAHEVAHADRRHSMQQYIKNVGLSLLLQILTSGDGGELLKTLGGVAGALGQLKFSREDESEADRFSIYYLSDTKFDPTGAAGFFSKLLNEGAAGGPPQFLSTHPSPDNRVEQIYNVWQEFGAPQPDVSPAQLTAEYQSIVAKLPPQGNVERHTASCCIGHAY